MTALFLAVLLAGPTEPVYQYRATLARVIDGDTYEMNIDLGFHVHVIEAVRLYGWDCPERYTVEGKAVTLEATEIFKAATVIIVESYRGERSFDRWIAKVWVDGVDIGERLAPACTQRLR
jgi:micrococcal nuclease